MDRFDLLTPRENNGKTYFTKIGVMFANKAGDGFNIQLEALPLPGPDGCRIIAKRPQPRDGDQRQQTPRSNSRGAQAPDLDDDVPF